MLTSKQRASLRGMANGMESILQIGKSGVTDNTITQAREALMARELIKGGVLETCPQTAREAAQELADRLSAEIIQVIGMKFVLYKRNHKEPKIQV